MALLLLHNQKPQFTFELVELDPGRITGYAMVTT
jgi:hypothetical protein